MCHKRWMLLLFVVAIKTFSRPDWTVTGWQRWLPSLCHVTRDVTCGHTLQALHQFSVFELIMRLSYWKEREKNVLHWPLHNDVRQFRQVMSSSDSMTATRKTERLATKNQKNTDWHFLLSQQPSSANWAGRERRRKKHRRRFWVVIKGLYSRLSIFLHASSSLLLYFRLCCYCWTLEDNNCRHYRISSSSVV